MSIVPSDSYEESTLFLRMKLEPKPGDSEPSSDPIVQAPSSEWVAMSMSAFTCQDRFSVVCGTVEQ